MEKLLNFRSHDCAGVWNSKNAGETWHKTKGLNLFSYNGQSIEVDPVLENVVFLITNHHNDWLNPLSSGLWKSNDYGETFKKVVHFETFHSRKFEHNIHYDPQSIDKKGAKVWYAAAWRTDDSNPEKNEHGIYKSEDYGETFSLLTKISDIENIELRIYSIEVHPSNGNVFVASSLGFFLIERDNQNNPRKLTSGLPDKHAVSLKIFEEKMYVVFLDDGLYESINEEDFTLVKEYPNSKYVFADQNAIFLIGETESIVSYGNEYAKKWENLVSIHPPKSWATWRTNKWGGDFTGIVLNSKKPGEAVAFKKAQIWKTTNYTTWFDSSTLFTGFNTCGSKSVVFSETDPNKFLTFNADVGMVITKNNGKYFTHRPGNYNWIKQGWTQHSTMKAGSYPRTNDSLIVAAIGYQFDQRIITKKEDEEEWNLYGLENGVLDEVKNPEINYMNSFYHPKKDNVLFIGNKKSIDGGRTFEDITFLTSQGEAIVVGKCYEKENNLFGIFAVSEDRTILYRSFDEGETWEEYVDSSYGFSFRAHDSMPIVEVHPSNCSIIYAVNRNKADMVRFDGKAFFYFNFKEINNITDPEGFFDFPKRILVDTNYPNIIYVNMFLAGTEKHILRSLDEGVTWEDISYNIPRIFASGMSLNPFTGEIFVGGCSGTYIFPAPKEFYKNTPPSVYETSASSICIVEEENEESNKSIKIIVGTIVFIISSVFIVLLITVIIGIFATVYFYANKKKKESKEKEMTSF